VLHNDIAAEQCKKGRGTDLDLTSRTKQTFQGCCILISLYITQNKINKLTIWCTHQS